MKMFRFDPEVGKRIDAFGSMGLVISKLVRLSDETDIQCAYLGAHGVIGYHPTTKDQLFVVVQGEGWVRGDSLESQHPIKAGQSAFWEAGEWHESGTEAGMIVILIEGEQMDPTNTMPPV
jgi:mannose-6-phosphate isomerase-like protein (cupin superfamily)